MTRISFLMPTFNRAHYVAQSIRSVAAQMAPEDELIVINDGSTDETSTVLAALDERFTILNQENAGKSTALNRAMDQATGEFIWVCDDDDLLCEGAVEKLLSLLGDTNVGWAFGRYTRFSEIDGVTRDLGPAHWPDLSEGSVLRHVLEDAFMMQHGALVRRSVYDQVGPFDGSMLRSLDYEMFVRIALAARAAHTSDLIFQQRKHPGARGPASMLHAAGKSESVWKEWDRRIFERLRSQLGAGFYASLFRCENADIARRAGLLQRATIMARHDLWSEALEDWETAATISNEPLHPLEQDICKRAMAGRHGFDGALSEPTMARLKALRHSSSVARGITDALMDGLIWRLRDEEVETRALARELINALEGPLGVPRLLARRAQSKIAKSAPKIALEENPTPPSWIAPLPG
ncbi:MAG: glycosyltransferase family 2 protein [Pseudomonadota bacterium]